MSETFSFANLTKASIPVSPSVFKRLKEGALGVKYELSLSFVSPKQSHILNKQYRNKDKPTNILSFPLNKTTGEIIICPSYAKKEAASFDRTYKNYLQFLFIHGLIHLKGFDHGSTMEHEEQRMRRKFGV